MPRHPLLLALLAAQLACDPELDDVEPAAGAVHAAAPAHPAADRAPPAAVAPSAPAPSAPVMPRAREAFARTLELIGERYVDRELDEAALYTGAIEGVLARLIQLEGHPVNQLLAPDQLDELLRGSAGTIVGVGVEIALAADIVVVVHAIPGGPAAAADLRAGDRILAIDGARVQGLDLGQVADKIRGQAGTKVDLFVQRDTEEWHESLVRGQIVVPNVDSRVLDGGLGHLRLLGFAETTPAELDAAIAAMQAAGMRALVLDLRDCPGGVFDAAVAITGRFLADGQAIVSLVDRDGIRTTRAADGPGRWHDLPLVALIGPGTASGAELLAGALRVHRRATLIGQRTLGKGTVESIHELGNGWALKLSTARFLGADGEPLQGRGVRPDLPIAGDAGSSPRAAADDDPALAAARTWLEGQAR